LFVGHISLIHQTPCGISGLFRVYTMYRRVISINNQHCQLTVFNISAYEQLLMTIVYKYICRYFKVAHAYRYHNMTMYRSESAFRQVKRNLVPETGTQHLSVLSTQEDVLQKIRERETLLSISQAIASIPDKKELISIIKKELRKYLRFSDIAIVQYNIKKNVFNVFLEDCEKTNQHEDWAAIAFQEYPLQDGLQDLIMSSPSAVLLSVETLQQKGGVHFEFLAAAGISEIAGVRLMHNNEIFGSMTLLSEQPGCFPPEGLQLIERFSYHLSASFASILANERIEAQLKEINAYKEKLEEEKLYLQEEISSYSYKDIIGAGPEMQRVFHMLAQVSSAQSTVLLLGETGTGKELIARAIHNASPRKNKLMVKVNCAALPASLIESELFGHERGSFTGAIERRIGKFELANHGTLFLDEIGEMPLELQVKLLRALQEKEIERVGGKGTIKVDVRIIAATNRDLTAEIQSGKFRSDLYYRLNVFPIQLPPLRERPEDIMPLADFFVSKFSKKAGKRVTGITPRVVQMLKSYPWPGNVREMEHLIERSILLCNDDVLREIYLPKPESHSDNIESNILTIRPLEDMERIYIIEALKRCGGRVSGDGGAAELLQLPGTTLHSKMKKLGIKKADYYLR